LARVAVLAVLVGGRVQLDAARLLGGAVFGHVQRAGNRARVAERPLRDPGLECGDELGTEPAAVDRRELVVPGLARVEPVVEVQEVVDAVLARMGRGRADVRPTSR
jgi:hypothetical protein